MYAGQPEENLFFILLMAAILLALFWNDKVSSGGSGSSTTSTTTSTGSGKDDTGSGGSGRGRDTGKDSGGKDTGGTSGTGRDPFVRVKEQVDSSKGAFKLSAEAKSRSKADIVATGFVKMSHYPTGRKLIDVDSPEKSDYLNKGDKYELEKKGIAPGAIQYTAWTKDSKGRTGTYSDSFEVEAIDERGGGDDGGPDSDGGSGFDIHTEYGADGDGSDPTDGTPDPGGSGGGANPPDIEVEVSPDEDEVGARASDFNVVSAATSNSGEELDALEVEFIWPNGSRNELEVGVSGSAFREADMLSSSSYLDANFSLNMEGKYRVKITVVDRAGNSNSDYDQIVINNRSSSSSMSSSGSTSISQDAFETLKDEADYEENEIHGALEELAKVHERHRYQSELEEKILTEGKKLIEDLERLSKHLNRLNNGNLPDMSPSEINKTLKKDVSDIHTDVVNLKEDLNEEMSNEKTVEDLMPHLEEVFGALESEEERMESNLDQVLKQASAGSSESHG